MKARWFTTFLLLTWNLCAADTPVLKPATIQVVDQYGMPITHFLCDWWYETPSGASRTNCCDTLPPIEVNSTNGTFTVMTPSSCRLFLDISQRDLRSGYRHSLVSYLLSETNTERVVVVTRYRGIVVAGTVIDAATRRPVKEARVSPLIFTPPLFLPDRHAEVLTDANGRFEVHGVDRDLGIHVTHGDYLEQEVRLPGTNDRLQTSARVEVKLKRGAVIRGRVTSEGKPVAGANISDGTGKEAVSDQEGNFELRGAQRWWGMDRQGFHLEFVKEGFVEKQLTLTSVPANALRIGLEPLYQLPGRVLTPQGQPVSVFTAAAGPGNNPPDFQAVETNVVDTQGRFNLPLKAEGDSWLGVVADGFAPWEGIVRVSRNQSATVVTLNRGVQVTGKVSLPAGKPDALKIQLLVNRPPAHDLIRCDAIAVKLAARQTTTGTDGSFQFEHVRPDSYWLSVTGANISPLRQAVRVGDTGADLGVLPLRRTGRIAGRAYDQDGQPKKFARGEVCSSAEDRILFQTDEQGFFSVEQVPTGLVSVQFPFNATADVVDAHVRDAVLVENETTEVRLFDPSGQWTARFKIMVGDGSPAQFKTGTGSASKRKTSNVSDRPMIRLDLSPVNPGPRSFGSLDWEDLEPGNVLVVPDVQPGSYRVRITDWQGSTGLTVRLLELPVELAGKEQPATIRLGAGSITGRFRPTKKRVFISAVSQSGDVRHAYSDGNGNFCLRYLAPGSCTLYAHDSGSGWACINDVSVTNRSFDIGERSLRAGGRIDGTIHLGSGIPQPTTLEVVSDSGAGCASLALHGTPDERFELENLWPGTWTLNVLAGERILARKTVALPSKENVRCDIELKP